MAVSRIFDVLMAVVSRGIDHRVFVPVVLILSTAYVILECVNGPGGGEGFLALANALLKVAGNSIFAFGGWILSALLLAGGYAFFNRQQKRIVKQGAVNSDLKSEKDPERLSSTKPEQLSAYASLSREELFAKHQIVRKDRKKQ